MQAETQTSDERGKYGTRRASTRKPFQRTSAREIVQILRLNAERVSASEIARITGLSHQRVSTLIAKHDPTQDKAMDVLKAASYDAAVKWAESFNSAAKRGEHRPMRDCLIATGVVSPDPINQGVTVVIGAGDAGLMIQTHSKAQNDAHTLQSGTHNPAHDILIPHEPL